MKMKLLAATMTAMALTACSGNATNSNTTSENTGNEEKELLTTPDLAFADARGNVKSITVKALTGKLQGNDIVPDTSEGNGETLTTYTFDEQGRLTGYRETYKYDGNETEILAYTVDYSADPKGVAKNTSADEFTRKLNLSLTHDENGRITNFNFGDGNDYDGCRYYTYTWTDGRIANEEFTGWEWSANTAHKYDENGVLTEDSMESMDYDGTVKSTVTYKYNGKDDNGNWTSRTRTTVDNSVEVDGVVQKSENSQPVYYIETRTIEYYPAK